MMIKTGLSAASLSLFILTGLSGCYESPETHLYEPHVYKGQQDSDRIMKTPDSLEKALSQRLQRGQTDR